MKLKKRSLLRKKINKKENEWKLWNENEIIECMIHLDVNRFKKYNQNEMIENLKKNRENQERIKNIREKQEKRRKYKQEFGKSPEN